MSIPTKAKTECAKKLKKIAPQVTAQDRKDAVIKFQKSYVTISRYLTGRVGEIETGLGLLKFFYAAIEKRRDELNDL